MPSIISLNCAWAPRPRRGIIGPLPSACRGPPTNDHRPKSSPICTNGPATHRRNRSHRRRRSRNARTIEPIGQGSDVMRSILAIAVALAAANVAVGAAAAVPSNTGEQIQFFRAVLHQLGAKPVTQFEESSKRSKIQSADRARFDRGLGSEHAWRSAAAISCGRWHGDDRDRSTDVSGAPGAYWHRSQRPTAHGPALRVLSGPAIRLPAAARISPPSERRIPSDFPRSAPGRHHCHESAELSVLVVDDAHAARLVRRARLVSGQRGATSVWPEAGGARRADSATGAACSRSPITASSST